jgi:hypothetical protein
VVANASAVSALRYSKRIAFSASLAVLTLPTAVLSVHADLGVTAPTVACQANAGALTFGGRCIGVQAPTAPTQPAIWHHWTTVPPSTPPVCTPFETTEWAAASAASSEWSDGAAWTVDGQRIPIVYSTPQTDRGWDYLVACGNPAAVRFVRLVAEPRRPSPCSLQTAGADCLPGVNPTAFLAEVAGQVPAETVAATPAGTGMVGVRVQVALTPAPVAEYAEIDVSVPDAGDGDPGETLHVVWVVEAIPEVVSWAWPDGSASTTNIWIPQTYVTTGLIRANVEYTVTAEGFWSDGVDVHKLPTVLVGTIPIASQLGYSVEQVQPGLG